MQNFEKYMQSEHKGKTKAVFSKELERLFHCKGTEVRRMVMSFAQRAFPFAVAAGVTTTPRAEATLRKQSHTLMIV
ncbi:MAG: hypothetical protein J6S14_03955 [Clostridia bacterium]|nr:hypothetical protein [Clostridia bacterium]